MHDTRRSEWLVHEAAVHLCVILARETYLLTATNFQKGAFDVMDSKSSFSQQCLSGTASSGDEIFISMSHTCMELTTIKRQHATQTRFKDLLQRLRVGEPNRSDVDYLMEHHLSNYNAAEVHQIRNKGTVMYLFATKEPRDEHNFKSLSGVSADDNPVALIKAKWTTTLNINPTTVASHFDNPPMNATLICRGAMVRIINKNFDPRSGLYNNAIGTVTDIVFQPGDDPNNGDHPLYVAVYFKHYNEPAWITDQPKVGIFLKI